MSHCHCNTTFKITKKKCCLWKVKISKCLACIYKWGGGFFTKLFKILRNNENWFGSQVWKVFKCFKRRVFLMICDDIRKLSNGWSSFYEKAVWLIFRLHINYLIDSHDHDEFSYPFPFSWIIYVKEPSRYLHIILIHSFVLFAGILKLHQVCCYLSCAV